MENKVYMATVSQINQYIKQVIEKNVILANIWVKGEISNCKRHYSGHIYLTLKDDGSVLKSVMFRSAADKLTFEPQDGMRVMARGRIGVYEKGGAYQLYIEQMQPDGVGELHIAYEQMKARLQQEGLFDEKYKKPLPRYPQTVGVVTASTGAAVRDMIHVLGRRAPYARILLYPSLVQGEGAAASICRAIAYFNETQACDVLIVGRGGGSIEDLWAFNEESVARAIFDSKIPVISAVGHETDFTIADFVADLRAPTPSAAAEVAAVPVHEIGQQLSAVQDRMGAVMRAKLESYRTRLATFSVKSPRAKLDNLRIYFDGLLKEMVSFQQAKLSEERKKLAVLSSKLQALSPLQVLSRGYCLAQNEDGTVIASSAQLKKDDEFTLVFRDGKRECLVK